MMSCLIKSTLFANSANSFILFNELDVLRFLGEIKTDNLTVSSSEIIIFNFTVSKIGFSGNSLVYFFIE